MAILDLVSRGSQFEISPLLLQTSSPKIVVEFTKFGLIESHQFGKFVA